MYYFRVPNPYPTKNTDINPVPQNETQKLQYYA